MDGGRYRKTVKLIYWPRSDRWLALQRITRSRTKVLGKVVGEKLWLCLFSRRVLPFSSRNDNSTGTGTERERERKKFSFIPLKKLSSTQMRGMKLLSWRTLFLFHAQKCVKRRTRTRRGCYSTIYHDYSLEIIPLEISRV